MKVIRQVIPIVLMPFMVVAAVPSWLLTSFAAADHRWPGDSLASLSVRGLGVAVFAAGLGLFLWCVVLFARVGEGTLAPWDPTRKLVAAGPYRRVRNPMISGVALMLLGEALFSGSWINGAWFVLFLAINHIYFVLSEEPGLEKRFGESYRNYKKTVPRWLPHLRAPKEPLP